MTPKVLYDSISLTVKDRKIDMAKWEKIPDEKVRAIWKCEECDKTAIISPDWYTQNGTPMCCDCDEDMVYKHTEINTN